MVESDDGQGLRLWATVTERGMKSFDVESLFGRVQPDARGGGVIHGSSPASEVEWYAARLLSVGTDVLIESPPELIEAIRRKARELGTLYQS